MSPMQSTDAERIRNTKKVSEVSACMYIERTHIRYDSRGSSVCAQTIFVPPCHRSKPGNPASAMLRLGQLRLLHIVLAS
jgi:hypothetical protein